VCIIGGYTNRRPLLLLRAVGMAESKLQGQHLALSCTETRVSLKTCGISCSGPGPNSDSVGVAGQRAALRVHTRFVVLTVQEHQRLGKGHIEGPATLYTTI